MLKFVSVCGEGAGWAGLDSCHGDGGGEFRICLPFGLTPAEQFEKGEQVK